MKKYLLTIGLLLFSLLSVTDSFAQTGPEIPNPLLTTIIYGDKPGDSEIYALNSECQFRTVFKIQLANLSKGLRSTPKSLPLPSHYPPMFITYDVGDIHYTGQINSFSFSETFNGYPIYTAEFEIIIDMTQSCAINMNRETQLIPWSSEIFTYDAVTGEQIAYPFCAYTAPDEIFSCEVFVETNGFCAPNSPACDNRDLTMAEGVFEVDCGDCGFENDGNPGNNKIIKQPSFVQNASGLPSISPNPFDNVVNLRFPTTNKPVTVRLFDTSGQLVKQMDIDNPVEREQYNLSTTTLPRGIYFLTITGQQQVIQSYKMVKF